MPFSARVLVLDGDHASPLNIGDALGAHGYRALHAESVDAAREIASQALLDVAIINAASEESNGTDVIAALKGSWRGAHMPLIVVSEDIEFERKSLDSAEGMADFLPRSFKEVELFSRLTSLVRLNTMQRELARRHATAQKFGVDGPRHVDPPGGLSKRNILIVARESEDAGALRAVYPAAAKVTVLADPYEAMDFLLLNKLMDAIILSVSAAGDEEYHEFAANVRRNSRMYNMPLLVVVAAGSDTDALYAIGASEVLSRPIQPADLLFRTETLVRQNLYRLALRSVFREARDSMTSDSLTGLYSYGFLYEHLAALIADATECEKNLSVGFFDMQGITLANRTYGYVAGDKVLRQIGSLVGNLVRGEDLLARHGGDQFCVLMPDTALAEAEVVLRRIAGVVTNTEYAVLEAAQPVQVTMKAGYAAFEDGDDPETLIARARHRSII